MTSSFRRSMERRSALRNPIRRDRHRVLTESLETRRLMFGGTDVLVNNNNGSSGSSFFTQSETSIIAWDNNVVIGFNDSGSNAAGGTGPTLMGGGPGGDGAGGGAGGDPGGGSSGFTGWARSTNGGASFTDGGGMPENVGGNAGDPVLARNSTTGRIYHATLGFTVSTIRVFRSDDNAVAWQNAVTGTPGGSSEDKQWMAVDNNAGTHNGNVYLVSRRFAGTQGLYFHRSTDQGGTFSTGLQLWSSAGGVQGAFVLVGPDHAVYAFAMVGTSYQMRKSTDGGVSFATAVAVSPSNGGGVNGDLALTGQRNGLGTFSGFRSNGFAHFVISPVTGHLYGVFANNPAGADKADIQIVTSTNGGASWSAPVRVNDDAGTTDQWQPTLAITPDGTRLGVFYYSRQLDAANNTFRYWGRLATVNPVTGALTFTASESIGDVQSMPEFGRDSLVNPVYMGDYDHAAATNTAFHVVWSDSRSALPGGGVRMDPNIYYDKISIVPVEPNGIWDGGGDGINWTDANNWSNNVLPTAVDNVVINIAANPNIVVNGAHLVNSVAGSENLTINGTLLVATASTFASTVTVAPGGTLGGAGNIVITGSIVMTGGTVGAGGTTITINPGAAIQFSAPAITHIDRSLVLNGVGAAFTGGNQLIVLKGLTMGAGATMNMTNNDMIIDYTGSTVLGQIQSYINSARNGGLWNGPGLGSVTAQFAGNTTLGAIEGTDFGASYGGEPLDGTAVIVKYTYYGDTDFNGEVNFDDYARADAGFNFGRTGWFNGDFDGNGTVNFDDFSLIDLAFNTQGGPLRPGAGLLLPSANDLRSGRGGKLKI